MSEQRRAIVFANGLIQDYAGIPPLIDPGDFIIAADGGAKHCDRLGLRPDTLIGDFDSLTPEELQVFAQKGVEIIRHSAHKDYTDLELALQHAGSLGVTQVLVLGGLGSRWDQTLANMLLPASADLRELRIRLIDGEQEITMLHSGGESTLQGEPGDTVSLIPVGGDAHGVSTHGLEYPLQDEVLYLGATRGISNSLVGKTARVAVKQGSLVCVIIHQTPGKLKEASDD